MDSCVRRSSVLGAVLLTLLVVACAAGSESDGAAPAASQAEPLDRNVLDNALLNESQFGEGGYTLEGRAWLAPDVGLSFYLDDTEHRFFSLLMRGGADVDEASIAPADGETFADYVARMSPGTALETEVGSTGPNVLLFDPDQVKARDPSSLRTEALGRNDYCPKSWFDAHCSDWVGWNSPSFPLHWKLTDQVYSNTQAYSGVTGVVATACADVGTIDFSLTASSPRWGTIQGSTALTLNQGNAQENWTSGSYKEEEYCKTHVLGVCVDYAWRVKFQTFTASATLAPRSGAEGHFCGTMTQNPDYYQGDYTCETWKTCPYFCAPGDTTGYCTYRGPRTTGP
jgi:hypothetical protein